MAPPQQLGPPKSLLAEQLQIVYGTRAAGMSWEETYRAVLRRWVLKPVEPRRCFEHLGRGLHLVVQGYDLTALGLLADLD